MLVEKEAQPKIMGRDTRSYLNTRNVEVDSNTSENPFDTMGPNKNLKMNPIYFNTLTVVCNQVLKTNWA